MTTSAISGLMRPLQWFLNMFNGGDDGMTTEKALTSAAFFYGVRKISNNFSMLPCSLLRLRGDANMVQENHPAHQLLKSKPNAYQTPVIWKQQHMNHAIMWGNGMSYIHRDDLGTPLELIPLMPDRTIIGMIKGEKYFAVKPLRDERFDLVTDMRNNPEETVLLPDSDVIHLLGFTIDGIDGMSLLRMAARTLNIDIGFDNHTRSQLKRGYAGGLMLEAPAGSLREEAKAKEFLQNFRDTHDGENNAGKTGLLREGVKANVLSMNNTDAQLLENRKFSRQQIALWLGLESIMGDDNSVSYNSLEQKVLAYLMNCLGPWLTQFEQQLDAKLLTQSERTRGYYYKVNDGALLRSDKAAAAEFVTKLVTAMIITRNEGRKFFDYNPVDGGDEFENPMTTGGNTNPAPDPTPAKKDTKSNNLALEATIRNLIKIEAKRVSDMSEKKDFITKAQRFYSRWESDLADKFETYGLDRDLARVHVDKSIDQLIAVSESSTPEVLSSSVKAVTAIWEDRVNEILKGCIC